MRWKMFHPCHAAVKCIASQNKHINWQHLTSSIVYTLYKSLGTIQVFRAGLNKFLFPVKDLAVKGDETKVVVFCQVTQDME